ncbi:MAG: fructose-bisphosphate aldolase [Anaerolineae bacterium]|jgi:DhnA family fructose-bisphosphate aldolase class Ia|nr:fructose-bisphosphate aldolase [Anaerolineae bacterium]
MAHITFSGAGKAIRLGRILHPQTGRAAVVAYDHSLHIGAIPGTEKPGAMLETLTEAGADAFLISPGMVRQYASIFTGRGAPGLILRLDWSNLWRSPEMLGSPEGRTRLIGTVEDAVRLGADAVLAYMFIGYDSPDTEAQQVQAVALLAQACDSAGIVCMIEPMARGLRTGDHIYDPDYIALGARMACELGADVLKTDYSGSPESFRQVTAVAYRPVLIAGGPRTATVREALEMVDGALTAGASGLFFGRNVFQAASPAQMMRTVRRMIHEHLPVEAALELLA